MTSSHIYNNADDEDDDDDANQHNEDGVSSECIKKAARVFNDEKHISELFLAHTCTCMVFRAPDTIRCALCCAIFTLFHQIFQNKSRLGSLLRCKTVFSDSMWQI